MKVILTQPVSGLGVAGDVADVARGYARNYLLPRKLATPWTKGGQKQVDAIQNARATREVKSLEEAQSSKATIEAKPVTVKARAHDSGRLYGAVTPAEIASAIVDAGGPTVDKRRIEVPHSIRSTGAHSVHVRLHEEVAADVELNVVPA